MPFASGLTLTSREANFNGNYPYGMVARGPYTPLLVVATRYDRRVPSAPATSASITARSLSMSSIELNTTV